jgi:hypothetical protein
MVFWSGCKLDLESCDYFHRLSKRVFPKAKNSPTLFSEYFANFAVSRFVSGNLWFPEMPPRFGHPAMPPASVPETAVHKHCQPFAAEDKVWFAGEQLVTTPTIDSVSAQD